jgi:murein DD-endopeptidase MepM/ murein hydrolase activator NlpD
MRIRTVGRLALPLALAATALAAQPGSAGAAEPGSAGAAGAGAAGAAAVGPDYEMPFPCGDTWNGSSRYNHSPSALAIDWNRTDDLGAMTVATAPGVVTSAVDLGNRSYGRYVVVDHGGGHTSLYAHLSAFWATTGEAVDQGTPIGLVGSSGGSTGPHLHFEERLDRRDQHAYFHRQPFTMGTTLASRSCGDTPVIGDWDGNGTANVGIQRRSTTPTYFLRRPGRTAVKVAYGWRTDQPLSGDWDGDGRVDLGSRRPGMAAFELRSGTGSVRQVRLGRVSDVGLTGDWDGDGRTDLAVWHPSTRVFTLRAADGSTRAVTFGSLGDRPVTGDWDGDGRTDLGVFTAATATFTLRTVASSGVSLRTVRWGTPTSLPVAGDWNGDHVTDVGVWDPATARFSLRVTPTHGTTVVTHRPVWGLPRG